MGTRRNSLSSEDLRLWCCVTATVRPHGPLRPEPKPKSTETPQLERIKLDGLPEMVAPILARKAYEALPPQRPISTPLKKPLSSHGHYALPYDIEPNRKRRLSRERDRIEALLDLHNMTSEAAHLSLMRFLEQAYACDLRAVLVITGKGLGGDGVLKRLTPHWLADPELAHIVAGVSPAHAKHGGSGALYVALKRR